MFAAILIIVTIIIITSFEVKLDAVDDEKENDIETNKTIP